MIILLHTSKTMRAPAESAQPIAEPQLLQQTRQLAAYLKTLSPKQLERVMHISPKLAVTTATLLADWTDEPKYQRAAIDSFIGDIYSGLQVQDWTSADRAYANTTLRILSGLYGILRPLDGIYPYRFEMGYKVPDEKFTNLYTFWGNTLAQTIPIEEPILNLAAVEYSKTITKYVDEEHTITPSFLTIKPGTTEPVFVVVHTKIARGAFARWVIKNRITDIAQLTLFNDLGYEYNKQLSSPQMPVFVCSQFGGIGLSVRLAS